MRLEELFEASGHIPTNSKEANDPRWSNAITVDVQPGEDERQAAKLGFKVKAGRPPKLDPSGKVTEAVMDVALQGRQPASPGSMGLMRSRADFGLTLDHGTDPMKGAVDSLAAALGEPCKVDHQIEVYAHQFKITPEQMTHAFRKAKNMSPAEFHKNEMHRLKHSPMKI